MDSIPRSSSCMRRSYIQYFLGICLTLIYMDVVRCGIIIGNRIDSYAEITPVILWRSRRLVQKAQNMVYLLTLRYETTRILELTLKLTRLECRGAGFGRYGYAKF